MGAVWLGTDQVLGRQVALKRLGLAPGVGTPDFERAEREARLAARLNHPHVVAVFDLVEEGVRSLAGDGVRRGAHARASWCGSDGALTPDEAAPLLRQAADALAAAHESGIVHRDVKPSNILVTPEGQVKLSDFGIARAEADASLTQTGLVTGSPAYLAPEVASGQMATAAADVWSLGATAFHALAGRPPYEVGDNVMGALYRIVHEEPPRLPKPAGWAPLLEQHHDQGSRPTAGRCPRCATSSTAARWRRRAPELAAATRTTTVLRDARRRRQRRPRPAPTAPRCSAARPRHPLPPRPVTAADPAAPSSACSAGCSSCGCSCSSPGCSARSTSQDQSGSDPVTGGPSGSTQSAGGVHVHTTPTTPRPAPRRCRRFVSDYVAAAIEDPKVSWQMLTPDFQRASAASAATRSTGTSGPPRCPPTSRPTGALDRQLRHHLRPRGRDAGRQRHPRARRGRRRVPDRRR